MLLFERKEMATKVVVSGYLKYLIAGRQDARNLVRYDTIISIHKILAIGAGNIISSIPREKKSCSNAMGKHFRDHKRTKILT